MPSLPIHLPCITHFTSSHAPSLIVWPKKESLQRTTNIWYGHVLRKDDGYIGRRMLRMELPGKRKQGRPKRRFMDVVKEDMAEVEVKEEDADDRSNWRLKIRCGDP